MDTLGFSLDTDSSTCLCEPILAAAPVHQQQQSIQSNSNLNKLKPSCLSHSLKNHHYHHHYPPLASPSSDLSLSSNFTRTNTLDENGNHLALSLPPLSIDSGDHRRRRRLSTHILISYSELDTEDVQVKSVLPCHRHYHRHQHQALSIEQFSGTTTTSNSQFDSNHRRSAATPQQSLPIIEAKISISLSPTGDCAQLQHRCRCQPTTLTMNQIDYSGSRSLSSEPIGKDGNVTIDNNKLLIRQQPRNSKRRGSTATTAQLASHSNETSSREEATTTTTANYDGSGNTNTNRTIRDRNVTKTSTKATKRGEKRQSSMQRGEQIGKQQTNYQVDMSDSNTSNDTSSAADAPDNYNEAPNLPMYKVPRDGGDNNNNNNNSNGEDDMNRNRLLSGHKISLPLIISPVSRRPRQQQQQNFFHANQVNTNQNGTSSAATAAASNSPKKSTRRNRPSPPNGEYFTTMAMKPSCEQIADCIIADNIPQLYKWVLDGFGRQVYSWRNAFVLADSSTRMRDFMTQIPKYQATIEALHGAIAIGEQCASTIAPLIGRRIELLLSRDSAGQSPLHKAVLYQRTDSIRLILNLAPIALQTCDNEGRTPLHLSAFLPDNGQIYRQLVEAGAMTTATDMYYRRPEDYLQEGHYRSPSSSHHHHQHQHKQQHQQQGPATSAAAPSITLNYGANFAAGQTHREPKPATFDITTDQWYTETDENFNYEVCYDRWWLPIDTSVSAEQQQQQQTPLLVSLLPTTGKHSPESSFQSPVYKQTDKLTIPPLVSRSSVNDKLGELATGRELLAEASSASRSHKMTASNGSLNRLNVKELIKQGNLTALEDIVLQGNGDRLLGETSSAPLVQEFLDNLPTYLDQISELHKAAARGNLREFQQLLDRSSLVQSRDPLGATVLHKATLYGHLDLAEYIASNYGTTALDAKDNDGRTALHYAAGLTATTADDRGVGGGGGSGGGNLYQMLLKYGAKPTIIDQKQKTADFYQRFPDELNLAHIMKRSQRLNANHAINLANRIKSKSPSRRKERSLSPTLPWNNGNGTSRSPNGSGPAMNGNGDIDGMDAVEAAELSSNDGSVISNASTFNIKRSSHLNVAQRMEVTSANLRRWIEENNLEMLEGAVIEGHGERIREKASGVLKDVESGSGSQVYIEETVPQMMSRIQTIHAAVSLGDLTSLQQGLETKKDYILSKDHLGMTPLHKATIMGHVDVVQYILEKFPETVNSRDREGRTALHYSTATTNRNGSKIYKMLIRAGADPRVRDLHGKTADYYRVHLLSLPPNETLRGQLSKVSNTVKPQQSKVMGLLGDNKNRRLIQPAVREKINSALHLGNVGQLTELIIDGFGQELLGRTSFGEDARKLLKNIPHSLESIRELQEAVINGDQETLGRILTENAQFARVRDSNSFTLLHLAVVGGQMSLVNYLVENHPTLTATKDNMNRTALHLAALTGNTDIYRRLFELGLDPKSMDQKGKTAEYYLRNNPAISSAELQELLALSNSGGAPGGVVGGSSSSSQSMNTLQSTNNRLSKMNGKPGSQLATNGIAGAPLKMSSKPVRLPALSRPSGGGGKTGSSTVKSQAEEGKKEQVKSASEKTPEPDESPLLNGKDDAPNGELQNELLLESDENATVRQPNGQTVDGKEEEREDVASSTNKLSREESAEEPVTIMENSVQQSMAKDATEEKEEVTAAVSETAPTSAERVIVYSRGEDQQWTQFDEEKKAEDETNEASEAINQYANATAAALIATEETVEDSSEEQEPSAPAETKTETMENGGDVINEANETANAALDTTTAAETSQTNGGDAVKGDDNGGDPTAEKEEGDESLAWNKPADDVIEQAVAAAAGDHSERALSQQFKGVEPKESIIARMADLKSSTSDGDAGQMMQVVYGRDAPALDDEATRRKRSWTPKPDSAGRTEVGSSQSDPQLNWEGRKSSANTRYVMNEPLSQSADSAMKKGADESTVKKMAAKRPESGGVTLNKEQLEEMANAVKADKGPWPETIVEEMEQKGDEVDKEDEGVPTEEDKLEQIIEASASEDEANNQQENPTDNQNGEGGGGGPTALSQPARAHRNADRLNELIKHWLEEGDLLRLEHVVIAGQGDRLLSVKSEDKQVQDFLNLVPAYMEKIRAVHTAVAHGNTEEVQKVLTRKRFALCRDQYGASPLHLAVLHQHVDILIYIITQFPETIDGPDNDGRTPLMYAAVLPESNRQIYTILETANASKDTKDRFGYSARDYLTNEKLTIRDLLIKYSGKDANQEADLWERPPTSEIISQLTPDTGSVPSTANGEPMKMMSENEVAENSDKNEGEAIKSENSEKSVQILQIEPRTTGSYSVEGGGEEEENATAAVAADAAEPSEPAVETKENSKTEAPNASVAKMANGVVANGTVPTEAARKGTTRGSLTSRNSKNTAAASSTATNVKRGGTFDRSDSKSKGSNKSSRQSSKEGGDAIATGATGGGGDRTFESMSDEFSRSLRNEKIRLQKSIDRQLSSTDVIKANGSNGSVIDSIQDASRPNVGGGGPARISNGLSATGHDLTQIKDEHGRTVLHLAAAKDQKRTLFYKMLSQADYLVAERDAKYRTVRDTAVLNGLKNNLQVIDQFILDCFIKERRDYLKMLMLEGYSQLLTVVDAEGNDVIALLKKHSITTMEPLIHELAEIQKNRDELHTFIRHGYVEGVANLVENNGDLVTSKSERGRTALHLAVLFGNLDIIEALINANIKAVNTPDNLGRSPLHYAMAMSKMEEIGRILIHCGANKAVRDVRMRTPTYYFVYKQEIRDIKREEQFSQ